jgi:hypothetical protein
MKQQCQTPDSASKAQALAEALDLSVRSVYRYRQQGMPSDVVKAQSWYQARIRAKEVQAVGKQTELLRWRRARATLAKLQLEIQQGAWLEHQRWNQVVSGRLTQAKRNLLGIPLSMSGRLAGTSKEKARTELEQALRLALDPIMMDWPFIEDLIPTL